MHFILSVLSLVLAICIQQVSAFHFYLGGDKPQEQCFYQDLHEDTVLATKHHAMEYDPNTQQYTRPSNLYLQVTIEEVFDNNHRVYNQKLESVGDATFTAFDSGEHKICYRAMSGGWFHPSKVKVILDIARGTSANIDSSNSKKLTTLAERVRDINAKMEHIKQEQHLMREREASFRDQSESTNANTIKWTLFQIVALGATCAWQLHHLRGFFMKQKLV